MGKKGRFMAEARKFKFTFPRNTMLRYEPSAVRAKSLRESNIW